MKISSKICWIGLTIFVLMCLIFMIIINPKFEMFLYSIFAGLVWFGILILKMAAPYKPPDPSNSKLTQNKLTQEILNDLFQIYVDVFKPQITNPPRLKDVKKFGTYEYRVGSKWCGNSKFWIHGPSGIRIRFDANFPKPKWMPEKQYQEMEQEIEQAEALFDKRVNQYLLKNTEK